MKNIFLFALLTITFSITHKLCAQDENWIRLDGKLNNGRDVIVSIAGNDKYIVVYPLKEVSLWLCTHSFGSYGSIYSLGSPAGVKMRFRSYTNNYEIMSCWIWRNNKGEYEITEVPISEYGFEWVNPMKESILADKIWMFVSDYLKK
jgi:hypothetical protein